MSREALVVIEVRRPTDDELCGHVVNRDGRWQALTVFGAVLGEHDQREQASTQVRDEGLTSLADRWTLRRRGGESEVVCIQEASGVGVTVARGYYSLPGVPTIRISRAEIEAGEWIFDR